MAKLAKKDEKIRGGRLILFKNSIVGVDLTPNDLRYVGYLGFNIKFASGCDRGEKVKIQAFPNICCKYANAVTNLERELGTLPTVIGEETDLI